MDSAHCPVCDELIGDDDTTIVVYTKGKEGQSCSIHDFCFYSYCGYVRDNLEVIDEVNARIDNDKKARSEAAATLANYGIKLCLLK